MRNIFRDDSVPSEIPKKRMIPEVVINPSKRGKIEVNKRKGVVVEEIEEKLIIKLIEFLGDFLEICKILGFDNQNEGS